MNKKQEDSLNRKRLQTQYSDLLILMKEIKSKVKTIEKQAKNAGYYVSKGKILENKKELSAFWNATYYSHFDGHTSEGIYKYFTGSCSDLSKGETERFYAIHKWLSDGKSLKSYIDSGAELIDVGPYEITESFLNYPEKYNFKIKEDYLRFEYKGSCRQGEMKDGTFYEIRIATKSELIKCEESVE